MITFGRFFWLYFANTRKATHLFPLELLNRESKPASGFKDSIQRESRAAVLDLLAEWGWEDRSQPTLRV